MKELKRQIESMDKDTKKADEKYDEQLGRTGRKINTSNLTNNNTTQNNATQNNTTEGTDNPNDIHYKN